jgi:DNA polymerase I-like protein with 3'-5' exonuclease and polymerase domains
LRCYVDKSINGLAESGVASANYTGVDLLIGHNLKFDLLYLLRAPAFKKLVWPKILVWDTALAEYLLTGQDSRFPSLDECSLKYGGTIKDKRISEMWDAGIQTEDIDNDLLTEYLEYDLSNTELVFKKQFIAAQEANMLPLIWSQMLALKATTEMELNGMHIDTYALKLQEDYLADTIVHLDRILVQLVINIKPTIPLTSINFNSNKFIGTVLYGGEVKYNKRESSGVYKTGVKKGLIKYINVEKTVAYPSQIEGAIKGLAFSDAKKVDEKTLKEVRKYATIVGQEFIDSLLKYRELSKELNTYVLGIKELVYEDGCVHGNLQHTATVTGRLSSSQPNLQNVTN